MDMRFGTWNVRSLYGAGSFMTNAKEISKCKLDLVGIRWDRDGTESAGEYTFLYGKGSENHELGTGFFYIRDHIKRAQVSYHCTECSCPNRA
jgi:hypothetical protein